MKKLILSFAITLIFINCYSQHEESLSTKNDTLRFPKEKNFGKDVIIFDVFTDLWQGTPDNIKNRGLNQGVDFYFMTNHPIGRSNFSWALGLGVSSHNFYSDGVPVLARDDNNNPTGSTTFETLGTHYQKDVSYKINKLNITYVDIPLEIKFKSRDAHIRQYKFSLGFKIGLKLSDHTKYKGNDVLENTDDEVTIKKSDIKNINNWNYGVTARIGYGFINVFGYYSLSKIFDKDKGPQMYPISIGISITPL